MSTKAMGQIIIRKIHDQARDNSAELMKKRKASDEAMLESQMEKSRLEHKKHMELHEKTKEQELEDALERRSGAYNRELLNYQQQLYDEIFELAVDKLRTISTVEFVSLLEGAAKGVRGNYILYLGALTQDKITLSDVDRIVSENEGLHITLSPKPIAGKSGFVFTDDFIEYNCLFEEVMETKKDEQAAEILKEVFFNNSIT